MQPIAGATPGGADNRPPATKHRRSASIDLRHAKIKDFITTSTDIGILDLQPFDVSKPFGFLTAVIDIDRIIIILHDIHTLLIGIASFEIL
jgi:hypothetical protein